MKSGDKVLRNPLTWIPNEFDSWGRGDGVGIIIASEFGIENDYYFDVKWPNGESNHHVDELLKVPTHTKGGHPIEYFEVLKKPEILASYLPPLIYKCMVLNDKQDWQEVRYNALGKCSNYGVPHYFINIENAE